MAPKALDLFQAYSQGKLPKEEGFIVSSFFQETSAYAIYEVVSYANVKNLYLAEEGLTFETDGNKLYILVEPGTFPQKFVEPFRRDTKLQIPHRFSELDVYTAKNQTRVMVSKEPIVSYGSFTILKPTGVNFSLIFYHTDEVMDTLHYFFQETLNKETNIPRSDARKAAELVINGVKKFGLW
ncbi:MAG TPA: hypothetical protein ENN41_10010 [Sediminispirochaeta sp.]|nr:hypothetical protein [Sediminispirochaeta sp.]